MDDFRDEYIADGLTAEEADEQIKKSENIWWRWKDNKIQVAAEGPYTNEEEW